MVKFEEREAARPRVSTGSIHRSPASFRVWGRRMLKAVILMGATLMSGCTAPPDGLSQGGSEPEPQAAAQGFLTAAEIRGFFEDGPVRLENGTADADEIFRPDGTYMLSGRATSHGAYRVGEGVLCVRLSGREERCRSVFRGDDGRLFLGDAPGLKRHAMPAAFVAFQE